ncbi:polysaccharide pyruvyl transferase family protein [Opitutus terrae]|uniref:Polysaccharide pyruvyl transferase domain-containing protein n=1 Tax=Opitutus terrae (strain DSM 11246 / JCM 15787 / PB90-1) TaxID=452637 RepID=B1ZRP7_OPITP|nr:polysaccharide pyruvyl transferase family protein [Opitutus terrae]ACB73740.1 hypothetical protein Oter_0450 [Opitutus terrae PB90-1]
MPLRVLVLNDTRRGSFNRHLGCNVVMENLLHLCAAHGLEVVRTLTTAEPLAAAGFDESLKQVDAVIVNGEGTMHHDSRGALALSAAILHTKRAGRTTALLNAVWQDNRQANACLGALDFVCARDLLSQGAMRAAGATHAHAAPDLSLYRAGAEPTVKPSFQAGVTAPAAAALVIDSVDDAEALRLRQFSATHGLPFRVMQAWAVREADERHPLAHERFFSLEDLNTSRVLITGRFHAICFAIKYGRPFLAVPSNTHKMEALLHDIGLPAEDFLLPSGWERRPPSFWIDHAAAAWSRHTDRIGDFAAGASRTIEQAFREMVQRLGGDPRVVQSTPPLEARRRKVRACVFSRWAGPLETTAMFLTRVAGTDSTPESTSREPRPGRDSSQKLARCVARLEHEAIEFLPSHTCGPVGLIDLARLPMVPGEQRWLISPAEHIPALGAHAGKVFGLLVRVGVKHLVLVDDEDQRRPAFGEIAPHLDAQLEVRGMTDAALGTRLADAIATEGGVLSA